MNEVPLILIIDEVLKIVLYTVGIVYLCRKM